MFSHPAWISVYMNTLMVVKIFSIFVFYSYTDAIPDFEAAIKLDGTIACFHVCLGLTYLLHSKQYQK